MLCPRPRSASRDAASPSFSSCLGDGRFHARRVSWPTRPAPAPGVDISTLLTQNPGDYALSLGHFLDLSTRAMGAFRVPLILTAIALGQERWPT
jgi:hypothetical protein